jgi:hypothetical protein
MHLAGLGLTVTFFALRSKKAASSPRPKMQALYASEQEIDCRYYLCSKSINFVYF